MVNQPILMKVWFSAWLPYPFFFSTFLPHSPTPLFFFFLWWLGWCCGVWRAYKYTLYSCFLWWRGVLNPAYLWEHQIYQTNLRQWNVIIPTILAAIMRVCKAISSIVVKISFGIHFKTLLIFFSVSMYAANIVSPIWTKAYPANTTEKNGSIFLSINKTMEITQNIGPSNSTTSW